MLIGSQRSREMHEEVSLAFGANLLLAHFISSTISSFVTPLINDLLWLDLSKNRRLKASIGQVLASLRPLQHDYL